MILCSLACTLLAIVAGMFLLAQTKKDNLGNFYKYVSWFVIVVGFLMVLCIGARSAMRCHRGGCMMTKECRMTDDDGGCMMMGHGMMGCHRGMMGGCGMMGGGCNMMMSGGCCGGMMMNGCCGHGGCSEGMNECHEGMGGGCGHEGMSECHEGMGECKDGMNMGGGSCPMMKGGMMEKKDSAKKK